MPVSSAFLREEKNPATVSGQEIRSGRRPMGTGLFPGAWCSRRQFLGLDPLQSSIKRSMRCGPRVCHLLASLFFNDAFGMSTCPRKVRGGRLDQGRERPNPWRNRTFLQTCPLLGERPCGDTNPQGKRESPWEGPCRANPRGVRAGGRGQRDRSPRKPMGPGRFQPHVSHWASFCGNSRTGVRLRCQQREIGAVFFTCFRFFRGCTWKVQMAN